MNHIADPHQIERRLAELNETIIACRKCPRLVSYREEVARTKRRAYRDWTYWGRPLPGFGDAQARLDRGRERVGRQRAGGDDPW